MIRPGPRVVVLTALQLEFQAVHTHLTDLESYEHEMGTRVEEGALPGTPWRVALAELGEGNTNAAALTERINSWLKPAALFFVGIAGAIKDGLELGDVVVATKTYAYQGGKLDPDGFMARPSAWDASHWLEQAARHNLRSGEWTIHIRSRRPQRTPAVQLKPIAAGDVVLNSADNPLSDQLRHTYNDAVAIEMEGAGFARAAHLAGRVDALTIRGISDKADGQKHAADAAGKQPQAAAHAAAAAIAVITALTPSTGTAASEHLPTTGSNRLKAAGFSHSTGAQTAAHSQGVRWEPVTGTVTVDWRRTGNNSAFGASLAALEIHLVPVPSDSRIEVRRLAQLSEELIVLGRASGFFTPAEPVASTADDQRATAAAGGVRQAASGLAVLRTGQRSAWQPLPHDNMGGILDPAVLPQQISELLALLARLPLCDPRSVALGIGVDPAMTVSEDQVSRMPRTKAQPWARGDLLRVHPDETLTMTDLTSHMDGVAEELAARLLTSFRRPYNGF
ncbi:5'-methylthioadenosine/S-adenosylhomocysteine nucleosidase [Streptomyces anulatus]|uniref:5'-methylthioadenosine/S-adenosylhomocysteine nucleosidase n=1 Tax=Streptomyces anulatus TaxID=1892 RepID=UPI001C255A7F|nr:5'-methylthioadenosine/S-adenosylhomocysteine nucleosidase [Streptomyces anulatus]